VDEAAAVAEFKIRMTTKALVLKRGDPSRRRDNDYDVLEDGKVVGRIFTVPVAASSAAAIFRQCAATSSQCFLSNEFAALSAHLWLSSACFRNSSAFDAMGSLTVNGTG
jgi:hypothetical protein